MKYRKKPVIIDAIQWTGTNMYEVIEFSEGDDRFVFQDESCVIEALEGVMTASKGDWIIKGVAGEFYPCKPAIFQATYDPIN